MMMKRKEKQQFPPGLGQLVLFTTVRKDDYYVNENNAQLSIYTMIVRKMI